MPFRGPIFQPGGYYHVYSRGIEKRIIFQNKQDRQRFLSKVRLYAIKYNFSIVAYCLMPNHYHLLIKQASDTNTSVFLQRVNLSYSMYFNKRYERVGPLFQGRFKARSIQADEYMLHLSRYIHLNPKEIKQGENLLSYEWSSYPFYAGRKSRDFLVGKVDREVILSFFPKRRAATEYKKFVEAEQEFNQDLSL